MLGSEIERVKNILSHEKIEIIFSSTDTKLYERPCIELLQKHSQKEDCMFLYIHSKGVTKNLKPVDDWIELMLYFLVDNDKRVMYN